MTDEDQQPVANPYRAALIARRDGARPTTEELRTHLAGLVAAMEAGAWVRRRPPRSRPTSPVRCGS